MKKANFMSQAVRCCGYAKRAGHGYLFPIPPLHLSCDLSINCHWNKN